MASKRHAVVTSEQESFVQEDYILSDALGTSLQGAPRDFFGVAHTMIVFVGSLMLLYPYDCWFICLTSDQQLSNQSTNR